jgi:hypothetical protein
MHESNPVKYTGLSDLVKEKPQRLISSQNFAQFGGLIIYDRVTSGLLLNEPDLWKIGNQLNTMADQADNGRYGGRLFDFVAGLTCTVRYVNSPPVSVTANGDINVDLMVNFTMAQQVESGAANGISVLAAVPKAAAPTTCFSV